MMIYRKALFAMTLTTLPLHASMAENPFPLGIWNCDGNGVCIDMGKISRAGQKVVVPAIVYYREHNHHGTLVRDCATGKATAVGVEGMPEDWPLKADFDWLCEPPQKY